MKIGIAGFGFVGQALYNSLRDKNEVKIYDKYQKEYNDSNVLIDCDVIFSCLPTVNKDGKQDISPYEELFKFLSLVPFDGIVVVKSTILYKNLVPFLEEGHKIVMNPEFLNQSTSFEDFQNQSYIVLGGRVDLCRQIEQVYAEEFYIRMSKVDYVTIEEACEFKYLRNMYSAYKVLFWNFVAESFESDHRKLAQMLENIPLGEMSNVAADGKFGFGGACLPKDLLAKHNNSKHTLSKFMLKYNKQLRD